MADGIEREWKWQLSLADHARLLRLLRRYFPGGRQLNQRNRFYDTPALDLKAQATSLRLRWQDQALIMTIKCRLAAAEGLMQAREIESRLNPVIGHSIIAQADLLPDLLPLPVSIRKILRGCCTALGGFDNERWEVATPHGLVALDHSLFPGENHEAELEVETDRPEVDGPYWRKLLAAAGIAHEPQTRTKMQRFADYVSGSISVNARTLLPASYSNSLSPTTAVLTTP